MAALGFILVHTATAVSQVETTTSDLAQWAEGEPDETPTTSTPFDCVLFLPQSTRQDRRGRQVKEPTLMWDGLNCDGTSAPRLSEAQELRVTACELTGPDPVRWQINGDPEPLGPPGEVLCWQARLIRVSDGADTGEA